MTAQVIVGDGTTAVTRLSGRAKRLKTAGFVAACLFVAVLIATVIRPAEQTEPLHPDNPGSRGAMALTRILEDRGVAVITVDNLPDAVREAQAGTTVFVLRGWSIGTSEIDRLLRRPADIVVADPSSDVASAVIPGLTIGTPIYGLTPNDASGGLHPSVLPANCENPAALAAREITAGGAGISAIDAAHPPAGVDICFGSKGIGQYAATRDGTRQLLSASFITQNQLLDKTGNAALAIHALGKHPRLVWFLPPEMAPVGQITVPPTMFDFVPPWLGVVGLLGIVVTVYLALWQGRRLGRLVPEPLPVVVRAAESTRGLGRLYRQMSAVPHAAAALRAGCATRCAQRLGLNAGAQREELTVAIAGASGLPESHVDHLLFGPPPNSELDLVHLADGLDRLEKEVRKL